MMTTLKQLQELSDARKKVIQSVIDAIKQAKPKTRSDAMHLAKAHAALDSGHGILATFHLKMIGESNDENIYYHVTQTKNIKQIKKEGLKPSVGDRSKKMNEKPSTFLFKHKVDAHDAVMNWLGDEMGEDTPLKLLKVKLPNHIKVHQHPIAGYEHQIFDHIHPRHISVEKDEL